MIEVEEDVDDLKRSLEGVGHGVPLAIKDKVCAGKLRIIIACKRMSDGSLNLNVCISMELLALKIGELVSFVLLYGTVDLIIEGDRLSLLGTVGGNSELGELLALVAYPRSSFGEVQTLNVLAVLVSNYEYGSTGVNVVCIGLIPLLDLVGSNSLKDLVSNVVLCDLFLVEGLFSGSNLSHTLVGVTEEEVLELEALTLVGSTVDVERVDLMGPDYEVCMESLEERTVDVVLYGDGVVLVKVHYNNNVNPTGPAVLAGDSDRAEICTVVTGETYGSSALGGGLDPEYAYGGLRPTVVGGAAPIAGITVSVNLELDTGVVVILRVDREGKEYGRFVSVRTFSKLGRLGLTGNPELMLSVCGTEVDELEVGAVICSFVLFSYGEIADITKVVTVSRLYSVSIVTVGAYVSNAVRYNGCRKVSVICCMLVCKTAYGASGSTVSCEGVSYGVAGPTARASGLLATSSSLGELVILTVKSVVTVLGITEVHVIEHNTGVSCIGPTGELKRLDLLGIKSLICTGIVKISGVGASVCTVDVVVNVDVSVRVHLDNNRNVEPLGPAVAARGNGSKVKVSAIETALNNSTGLKIFFYSKDGYLRSVPTGPISSASSLTDVESEGGIRSCASNYAGLHAEGNNTNCIVLAREISESAGIVGGRHPRLNLSAVITVFTPIIRCFFLGTGRLEHEAPSTVIILHGVNLAVRTMGHRRVFALTVPLAELGAYYEVSTACAVVGENAVLNSGNEVVLVSSVTEGDVIHLPTGTCVLVIGVYIYVLDTVIVNGERLAVRTNVLAIEVVMSDNLIGLGIENELDSYLEPTGVVVSAYFDSLKSVTEALNFCLAVSNGRDCEYGVVDSPKVIPTDGLSGAVTVSIIIIGDVTNELHLEVVIDICVDIEGEVTNGVITGSESGELISACIRSRKPYLKLLSYASLSIVSYELIVAVGKYGVSRVRIAGVGRVVILLTAGVNTHTVIVSTVEVVEGLYVEVVITYGTRVGKLAIFVSRGELMSVSVGLTLSSTAYGTGLCCCTGRSGVGVTESLTLSVSTYGTGLRCGTGCSVHSMTCRISEVTVLELGTTGMITSVNGVTAISTCGRYNLSCYKVTFMEVNATYGTYVIFVGLVSESCIFYVLGVKYLITYGTVGLYVVRTAVYTVGSNNVSVSGCLGMTERIAFGLAASGAVLRSFAISVYPSVLVLIEEPLGILSIAKVYVIKSEAGAGIGPTADVTAVDVKVLDAHRSVGILEISGVYVAEFTVDVVADGEETLSVDLHEHLNVYPLVSVNGSKGVASHRVAIYSVGAVEGVTVEVRHECKDIDRVAGPCAVSIPVGVVSSGHYDNAERLVLKSNVKVNAEREYAEGLIFSVPFGHHAGLSSIIVGEIDHVLRLSCAVACKYVVLAVLSLHSDITATAGCEGVV